MEKSTIVRLAVPFHPPNWIKFPILTMPDQSNLPQDQTRQNTQTTQTERSSTNAKKEILTTNGRPH